MPKQPQDHQTKQTPAERAEAEIKAGDGNIPVKWKGRTWHVLPVNQWDKSWRRLYNEREWDGWAACLLVPDEVRAWFDTPATSDDVLEFVAAFNEASGQDAGESQAS